MNIDQYVQQIDMWLKSVSNGMARCTIDIEMRLHSQHQHLLTITYLKLDRTMEYTVKIMILPTAIEIISAAGSMDLSPYSALVSAFEGRANMDWVVENYFHNLFVMTEFSFNAVGGVTQHLGDGIEIVPQPKDINKTLIANAKNNSKDPYFSVITQEEYEESIGWGPFVKTEQKQIEPKQEKKQEPEQQIDPINKRTIRKLRLD
jgi:hypothetical protein